LICQTVQNTIEDLFMIRIVICFIAVVGVSALLWAAPAQQFSLTVLDVPVSTTSQTREPGTASLAVAEDDDKFDHHGRALAIPKNVRFNAHIRGIMSNTCFVCHGPDQEITESDLRLDSFGAAVDEGGAIEPGEPEESEVYLRLTDEDDPMPPADFVHQLTDYEKALFKRWIEQGAEYEKHWAYSEIRNPPVPQTNLPTDKQRNAIDAFVFANLEKSGLTPADRADKATLLRRLSLDLIGLPPRQAELAAFLADDSPQAYEAQVERLMASPHFGERMAAYWLDLVRFSDTVGYHGDQNQRIFPYRDFVIHSLNSNQSFDEFTRDQLAGDLLPNPTPQQLAATGLIRLNMVTREGGAQPGEYLAKYTADRVRMLGTAWLGATTGCCECHNHKYDPFSIEDFYSLGAYFDDVRQWGVYSSYGYTPNADLSGFNNDYPFPPEMRIKSESLQKQIQYLERQLEQKSAALVTQATHDSAAFKTWLARLTKSSSGKPVIDSASGWHVPSVSIESPESERYESQTPVVPGSVVFTGPAGNSPAIEAVLAFDQPTIVRSLRLEVLPHPENNNRVGRSKDGRFSLGVSVQHLKEPTLNKPIKTDARFVRIVLPRNEILSLAEVQAFANVDGKRINVALQGTAKQISTTHEGVAGRANDGNTEGEYHKANSVTHTEPRAGNWWEVDLGREFSLAEVVVWNRTDKEFSNRLSGFRVVLLNANHEPVFEESPALPAPNVSLKIPPEFTLENSVDDEKIAFAQANRSNPERYSSGQPPRYLGATWRSGPARWQLPSNETELAHVAVYHLNQAIDLKAGEQLRVKIRSADVGQIRLSTSPVSRFVVGESGEMAAAMSPLLREFLVARQQGVAPSGDAEVAAKAAYYQYQTAFDRQAGAVTYLRDQIADCRSGLAMTMVSQPVPPEKLRQSRVLPRGDWQSETGKPVKPNTPHFLPGYRESSEPTQTRLDLAKWLTSPENPLTARHYVNRVWAQFFGNGLSSQLDDLGNQGEWPSHPEMMDWLAHEFKSDWDRKRLIRLIVMSHTYQQQAAVDPGRYDVDPYNRLLSQQSARRLEAEIIRDNALAISGLLNSDWIGGPSVFPYQPPGYYANIQFPNRKYVADFDGRQYRRGLYMHWQRTFLHPMLTNFDAPSRDECVAKRTQSNSPQQALTLLNDPVFVEASTAFADRVIQETANKIESAEIDDWIETAFRIAVSREPQAAETEALQALFERQASHYGVNPDDVAAVKNVGEFVRRASQVEDFEFAALVQVCRVVMNLHETITRY
jgi:hypothetical protein